MSGALSKQVKSERSRRLTEIESDCRRAYYNELIGQELQVLLEAEEGGGNLSRGTSCRYAPVVLPTKNLNLGDLAVIRPRQADGDTLLA